jgi:hypothetical protein
MPTPDRTRGFAAVICGLLVLMLNVIEAADRGATAWNLLSVALGAFLLFYGASVVARAGR